jgi:hypothetical protein
MSLAVCFVCYLSIQRAEYRLCSLLLDTYQASLLKDSEHAVAHFDC